MLMAETVLKEEPEEFKKICAEVTKTIARPWEGEEFQESTNQEILGEVPERLKSALLLADRISGPLAEGVRGNLKQIKRFMNTLMIRLRVSGAYGLQSTLRKMSWQN